MFYRIEYFAKYTQKQNKIFNLFFQWTCCASLHALLYCTNSVGLLRTTCMGAGGGGGGDKRCFAGGSSWRWVGSGADLEASLWNRPTHDPHEDRAGEHCAAMWTKWHFKWADWKCNLAVSAIGSNSSDNSDSNSSAKNGIL